MANQVPRSVYVPPTWSQPRQYVPRSGFGRGLPVSQSAPNRTTMGRGITRGNLFRPTTTYQSTHIGFDLQGEPMFEDLPVKIQKIEESYQVHDVGYDTRGEPMYEDYVDDSYMLEKPSFNEGDDSGYSV